VYRIISYIARIFLVGKGAGPEPSSGGFWRTKKTLYDLRGDQMFFGTALLASSEIAVLKEDTDCAIMWGA
jgi:hypothetical protein